MRNAMTATKAAPRLSELCSHIMRRKGVGYTPPPLDTFVLDLPPSLDDNTMFSNSTDLLYVVSMLTENDVCIFYTMTAEF